MREQYEVLERDDFRDEVPDELGILAQGVAVVVGRLVTHAVARKIETADAIVLLQFDHQRPEIEAARRKPMDHDDRGLCLITHADVEDLHWARLVFWQRGLPSEELAANLPLFGRAHYSVSQRSTIRQSAAYLSPTSVAKSKDCCRQCRSFPLLFLAGPLDLQLSLDHAPVRSSQIVLQNSKMLSDALKPVHRDFDVAWQPTGSRAHLI